MSARRLRYVESSSGHAAFPMRGYKRVVAPPESADCGDRLGMFWGLVEVHTDGARRLLQAGGIHFAYVDGPIPY
jgi:hypothetical protein